MSTTPSRRFRLRPWFCLLTTLLVPDEAAEGTTDGGIVELHCARGDFDFTVALGVGEEDAEYFDAFMEALLHSRNRR